MKKADVADILPLSPTQESMLYHYRLEPASTKYHGQHILYLRGELDPICFNKAVDMVVDTNEMLRAVFRWENIQSPVQIIMKYKAMCIPYYDWSACREDNQRERLNQLLKKDQKEHFQLESGDTMRIRTIRMGRDQYVLVWSFHHIIMDGWSSGVLLNEIFTNYGSLIKEQRVAQRPKMKYKQYLRHLKDTKSNTQTAFYWKSYLKDFTTPTELPFHRQEGFPLGHRSLRICLDAELTEGLEQLSRDYEVTLSTLLQVGWAVVLGRYSGTKDVLFEVAHTGRSIPLAGIEEMVGLFVSTCPQRVKWDATSTVDSLLAVMSREQHERAPYLNVSVAELKGYSGIDVHSVLTYSLFLFQNYPINKSLRSLNLGIEIEEIQSFETANYALVVEIKHDDGLEIHFNYDTSLLQEAVVERIAKHYSNVLKGMIFQPDSQIVNTPIFDVEEQLRLLSAPMDVVSIPADQCVHELFDQVADKFPDATALIDSDKQMSYSQLQQITNQLARAISSKVTGNHRPVAVLCGRSTEMIVTLLGILKSGSFYVPLDPLIPTVRIKQIIDRIQPALLITDNSNMELACELELELLNVQDCSNWEGQYALTIEQTALASTSPAYAMFTSGSTGKPKGVIVNHSQLINSLWWHNEFVGINTETRTLQIATLTFDASVVEIFCTLLTGGTLHLLQENDNKSPKRLIDLIQLHQINFILVVPTMYRALLDYAEHAPEGALSSVKRVICTGEMMTASLAKHHYTLLPQSSLYNLYGPTENSISASGYLVPEQVVHDGPIPIGKPSYNVSVYILDEDMQLLPKGSTGEIYLGGMGVTAGYIGDEARTAASYLETVYGRLYRTGDLARWLEDGSLQYFGRKDFQVKIRGNRVEIEEIEAVVRSHAAIKEAAVVAVRVRDDQMLALCYVDDCMIDRDDLRNYISSQLPEYMVPSLYKRMDALPYTASGKLNKLALQQLEYVVTETGRTGYFNNQLEVELSSIWCRILNVKKVDIDDHFYSIGGHSLKAAELATRIQIQLSVVIALQDVARYPTIRQMAAYIAERGGQHQTTLAPIPKAELQPYYRASSAQKKIFILRHLEEESTSYNMSGILSITGTLNRSRAFNTFQRIINRHEVFRTSFFLQDGEVYQRILNEVAFDIDSEVMNGRTIEQVLQGYIRPFDLSQAPLLRVALVDTENEGQYLLFDSHHIVLDGTSLNLLMNEFIQLYHGSMLPAANLQYKDYTCWFWAKADGEGWNNQRSFWINQFKDKLSVMHFPSDYTRPLVKKFEGSHHLFTIESDLFNRLNHFVSESGSTVNIVLLSAYYVLLHKYTTQEDLVVGSLVSGRDHPDLNNIVGVFVNFLPIRCYPKRSVKYVDFLKEVQETVWQAYDNQTFPLEEIVSHFGKAIQPGRNPLFDTMLIYHNQREQELESMSEELQLKQISYESSTSKLDFKIDVTPTPSSYQCVLEYDTQLFRQDTMKVFSDNFLLVLDALLTDPGQRLADILIMKGASGQAEHQEPHVRLHHIGVAVADIEASHRQYGELGIGMGPVLHDPLQNVLLSIGRIEPGILFELVAPVDSASPVFRILKERGSIPYHLCFAVSDIDRLLHKLNTHGAQYEAVSEKKAAVLFDNAMVIFIYMKGLGLVELVETGSTISAEMNDTAGPVPTVRLLTESIESSVHCLHQFGYKLADQYVCMQTHHFVAVLHQDGGSIIELTAPRSGELKQMLAQYGSGITEIVHPVSDIVTCIDRFATVGIAYDFADVQGIYVRPAIANYLLLADGTDEHQRQQVINIEQDSLYSTERSFIQTRWVMQEQMEGTAANVVFGVDCIEELDGVLLEKSIYHLLRFNPLLWPSDRIEEYHLKLVDVQKMNEEERNEYLTKLMKAEISSTLNVAEGKMVRFMLVRIGIGRQRIIGCLHASVCDGHSINFIIEQMKATYTSLLNDRAPEVANNHTYASFAYKQQRMVKYGLLERERKKWIERTKAFEYPFGVGGKAGASVMYSLSGDRFAMFMQFVEHTKRSVEKVLLTSYVLLLQQMTQGSVVSAGVAVNGRPEEGYQETIGNFVNYVPFILDTRGAASFVQLLDRTSQALEEAAALTAYPATCLETDSILSWPTLFVAQAFLPDRQSTVWSGTLTDYCEPMMTGCPLTVSCFVYGGSMQFIFGYDQIRVEKDMVESLARRFMVIVNKLAEVPK
ncbi:non-ribosomal peptide synthetase [Paenibacillus sp. P32E]|uniref:non-ribosomal peptide synthetase n=1 Tax=Paenibacillus sp. P32E TaxID=1349434 RepID=UPI00093B5EC6|nr:non-ribosomal peptide synthetase [Paenibacillus sp. P32E]OKP94756.1 hypothetical protein A3848_01930 [Paenibacillus sp. P32E]